MATSITLTGCDDFLTPDNKSSVTDIEYFATADGFQSLVNDAYGQLDAIFNSSDVTTYFNSGTDMYQDGRKDNDAALHRWSNFTPETVLWKTSILPVMTVYALALPYSTMPPTPQ
jgi:hypothetical protein